MSRPDAAGTTLAKKLITGLLLAAVAGLAVLSATVFVEPDWRHSVDSAIYLLTAKSLSLGDGYTYLGRPFFVRPPALSWCLSLVMGEGGGVNWDFALYNQLIQLSVAATLGAVLLAMSRVHGWCAAALVTLLFGLNPLALANHNTILAEYPFLVLFFTAAWLLTRRRDGRQPGRVATLLGAVLLAASVAFRTVGVLFLPGLVLLAALRLNGRRSEGGGANRLQGLIVAAIVVASLVPWALYTREASTEAERPSTQLLMYDYTTALFHTDPRDPTSPLVDAAGWAARVSDNLTEISQTVAHAFLGGPPNEALSTFGPEAMIVTVLLGACLVFTVLSRRSALDLFAATSVVLLLLYFTFADRLLLPLIPLILSSVVYTAGRLGRLALGRFTVPEPAGVAIGLVALAIGGMSLAHMEDSRALTSTKRRFQRDDLATAAWVREHLPEDARLLHEKGAVLSLLSGRTTYTYRNLPGPWPEGCPEVDYALFSPRPRREETETLVAAVAPAPTLVPFKWKGKPSNIRIYALGDE